MPHPQLLCHHQLHSPLKPSLYTANTLLSPNFCKSCLSLSSNPQLLSPNPITVRRQLPPQALAIRCMANPRRVKMVAKQIRRELSDMLLTDKVLQYAILPEAALGADRYLSSLTTISDVEVSADLQVVKVYVSVFGDERGRELAIAGLKAKAKYVRSELGRRMKLRLTPEIRFIEDESLERGSRVIAILDRIKNEKEAAARQDGGQESSVVTQEDGDWEDDDPDEGIIYVN
ncbi:Ribosome-binding factor A [Dillenia turbinata]|uniref:Ribosome-binding factor A n=1 Tax=Dillenia turbinata TaxID=194707 RepID=A0AAN8URH1_9MAGN